MRMVGSQVMGIIGKYGKWSRAHKHSLGYNPCGNG
jgi:hypothetical protein